VRKPWITALRARTSNRSEQGFAIPVAVGMGLITILVATTMMLRSQDDQVTASAQKATAQSLGIAEGGGQRTLGQLNKKYSTLLRFDHDPDGLFPQNVSTAANSRPNWSNVSTSSLTPCVTATNISTDLLTGTIGSATSSNYTLRAYDYNDPNGTPGSGDETGTMIFQGNSTGGAASVVQQTLPIRALLVPNSFPGLLATDINLGNNDVYGTVAGNVVCTNTANCPVPAAQCDENGEPTQAGLLSAVGANNNATVEGQIFISDLELPPLPTAPADGSAGTYNLGNINGPITLPRMSGTADVPDENGVYHYKVSSITVNGNDATKLRINTATPTTDEDDSSDTKVILYVSGNITFSGQAWLQHNDESNNSSENDGSPGKLRIYGNPLDPNNTATDQTFSFNGGAAASNLFVYAPDATMGVDGGSGTGDITGAVWVKTWNGSSSNNADVVVPDNMEELLGEDFNVGVKKSRTGSVTQWQRRATQQ